jgi:tRNA(Ile)-lysidine synthase
MEPAGRWPFGDGPVLYRPLLDLRREETARYCREAGLDPRLDATNVLPVATRNVVRLKLLPALREFNPRISEALARLGEAAATDAGFLQQQADRAYEDLARRSRGAVTLPRPALRELHPAVRSRVIARAALASGIDGTLQALHIAQVAALLEGSRGMAPLPGDVIAEVRGDVLRIHPAGGARRIS